MALKNRLQEYRDNMKELPWLMHWSDEVQKNIQEAETVKTDLEKAVGTPKYEKVSPTAKTFNTAAKEFLEKLQRVNDAVRAAA